MNAWRAAKLAFGWCSRWGIKTGEIGEETRRSTILGRGLPSSISQSCSCSIFEGAFYLTVTAWTTTGCATNLDSPPHIECLSRSEQCPVCGGDNQCRVAKGHLYKGPCWCEEITVPNGALRAFVADRLEPVCLCRSCLEAFAQTAREPGDTAAVKNDFYLDENENVVFTAAYHLRRGTCCGNGCRHCPF
jgi:hypothetical protein